MLELGKKAPDFSLLNQDQKKTANVNFIIDLNIMKNQ